MYVHPVMKCNWGKDTGHSYKSESVTDIRQPVFFASYTQ